jgi:hypothetical protein
MPRPSTARRNKLLDAFFFEQDQELLKTFHQRMEKMDRRVQLAQVSGIHDEAILDRLIELDVGVETMAAMAVVPLVLVAWADGKVQAKEREAILGAARATGIESQDGRYPLLERWLDKRPGAAMFEAWSHYIKGLCQQMNEQQVEELKHDLLRLAQEVAQTAGGFLGLGNKVSVAERTVLNKLEKAFS